MGRRERTKRGRCGRGGGGRSNPFRSHEGYLGGTLLNVPGLGDGAGGGEGRGGGRGGGGGGGNK